LKRFCSPYEFASPSLACKLPDREFVRIVLGAVQDAALAAAGCIIRDRFVKGQ
jgi:hypothetical protein